jgi:hypothetical protein
MITQATVIALLVLAGLVLVIPKRYILVPYMIAACFVPQDQRIIILGLDFTVLRFLVVAGVARIVISGAARPIAWNRFDKLVVAWGLVGALIYTVRWGTMAAAINRSGFLFDLFGFYWIFRQTIESWDDVRRAFATLAICALVMVPFVAHEWNTGVNPFAGILGRVATNVREGNYRCQATFPHSIMMGLFWVGMVPLFVGFARYSHPRWVFWAGVAASGFMAYSTASSTPILSLFLVGALLAAYPWRQYTGAAAKLIPFILIGLQMVMKAPVWHLISRVSVVSGSTGWHRFNLIDNAINHFSEWMLLGTKSTEHWGFGLGDVTNQFVLEGVRGGLVTLVLFCIMLYVACKTFVRLSFSPQRTQSYLGWCGFVTIVAHCVAFMGVSYFGQIITILYLGLAICGFCYESVPEHQLAVGGNRTFVTVPQRSH